MQKISTKLTLFSSLLIIAFFFNLSFASAQVIIDRGPHTPCDAYYCGGGNSFPNSYNPYNNYNNYGNYYNNYPQPSYPPAYYPTAQNYYPYNAYPYPYYQQNYQQNPYYYGYNNPGYYGYNNFPSLAAGVIIGAGLVAAFGN